MVRDRLYKDASSPFGRYSNLPIQKSFTHNHALEAVWTVHAAPFHFLCSRFFSQRRGITVSYLNDKSGFLGDDQNE